MNHSNRKFTSFSDLSAANLSRTLSSPVAESTHLEGSAGHNNISNNRSGLFAASPGRVVGSSVNSVKRKPTSPLFNSRTSFKSSGNLASMGGFGRIDSQVYTDAQSRGLVNRLVKYHDRTQSPLNRSQSMTSVYNKPGQFPVVHLKRTEIKYSPQRNNSITSVRIAPPEKSVFQANTRSNILRAGSLLIPAEPHLKQTRGPAPEDEIDAENRVIAPTAELESAPTRSVLDALKEISRKRINNEELDADRIKKQCKELSEVDSGGGAGGGTKRTRELTSSSSPPLSGSGEQQLQKKRLCSKSNDILSSLSSSLVMSTPKRVEQVQPKPGRLNVDQTFNTPMPPSSVGLNATVATEGRAESREPIKVSRIESAPLPQIVRSVPEIVPSIRPKPTQPKITLFNKKYDETVVRPVVSDSEEQEDEEELGGRISFIKPKDKSPILNCSKVTMKQVEKSKLSMILSCLSEDFDDDEEDEAPKKAPIVAKDTVDAVPPKVEQKKVEVAVSKPSGIAALISEPIKDAGLGKIEPPKPLETAKTSDPPKTTGGFSFGTPTKSDNNATFSFQTPTKPTTPVESKPVEKQPPTGGFSFGTTPAAAVSKADAPPAYSFPSTTPASSAPALTTSGFGFTSSTAPSQPTIATPKTTPNLISFSPAPTSKPEAPKSGFSLLPAISTNASSGSPQNSLSTTQSTLPTFGSGSGFSAFKPLSPPASTPAPVTTSASNLPSFGSVATSTSGVTPSVTPSGGFAFGASTLKPATTTAAAVVTSTTSAFTFGGAPTLTSSASAPTFGASAAPKFGFGSTTTAVAATTSAPSFGSTITTSAAAAATPPSFGGGFSAAPTTAPPPFGTVSSSSTTSVTSPPSSGIFGGGVATNKPAFGQQPQSAPTSAFSFGGAAASQQPASTTSSGGSTTTGAFSFGAVAGPTTTTAAPSTTTSNIFGTGGGISSTTSGFGAAPSFGSNSQVPVFGAASSGNPPAFGATNSSTASVAPAASGFGATSVFGAASSSPAVSANSSSVFGASSTATSPFGGISSGSAPTGNIFGAASSTNNQSNATSGSSPFSFGATPAAPASTNSAAAPAANKPFSFGGIGSTNQNATSTPAANPANSFAFSAGSNSSAQTPAAPVASAFSFSSSGNNNNSSSSVAPPPAFGSTGNSSFSFNATNPSQNTSNTATVKPFSFGTPSQPTAAAPAAAGGGIFGAAATSPPPAFNFSAGSNAGGQPAPAAFSFGGANPAAAPPGGGPFGMANGTGAPMFSIGTGGGANVPPGRRPIRTATRRLK